MNREDVPFDDMEVVVADDKLSDEQLEDKVFNASLMEFPRVLSMCVESSSAVRLSSPPTDIGWSSRRYLSRKRPFYQFS